MNTYGLARVSTLGQKENTSLDFQSKRIKDYCSLENLNLSEIIIETESGAKSLDDRTGLSELQSLIKTKACDTIIVNKVDRLGRSLLQGLLFLKYCEDNNVRVISISDNIDTKDNGQSKLVINILWSIAEHERDVIKSRLEDGRERQFTLGNKPFGKTPYGYKKNIDGLIDVDKEESLIVQYIYKRYHALSKMKHLTKTKRTQKLLHSLRMKGYKFRGKDFAWWNIKQIISNPFYTGTLCWKGMETKHNYEHIVSKRMFNQIQTFNKSRDMEKLDTNKHIYRSEVGV